MGQLTAMYVNDFDLSGLGLIVTQADGWLDAPSATDRTTRLAGRVGEVILAPEAETAPRTITVTGVIKRASMAAVRTAIDELKHRLYHGTIEVRFNDEPTRFVLARTQIKSVIATAPQFNYSRSRVSFRLHCPDPLIYEKNGSPVGFGSREAPVPLGTAVSAPLIKIMGAATNPTITYRDAAGNSVETMAFGSFTLAATDYLEIDCELMQISKFVSGVKSNAIDELTSGDFIALDPQDGDYVNSVWPTLEVDAGTGEALYRRAWV